MTAIQNISMRPQVTQEEPGEVFVIPAHTLYGEYPAKIAEDEINRSQSPERSCSVG